MDVVDRCWAVDEHFRREDGCRPIQIRVRRRLVAEVDGDVDMKSPGWRPVRSRRCMQRLVPVRAGWFGCNVDGHFECERDYVLRRDGRRTLDLDVLHERQDAKMTEPLHPLSCTSERQG